jgi:hypothetical protein
VSRGRFLKHMDSVNDGETTDDHSCAICLEVILKGVLFSASSIQSIAALLDLLTHLSLQAARTCFAPTATTT